MYWKSIGVLGKPNAAEQSLSTFQELFRLFDVWQISAYFESEVANLLGLEQKSPLNAESLIRQSDLILVVGGDGSMLSAARLAVKHNKSVLGINRGHLGFLTDIGPDELATRLRAILEGHFSLESRFLLEAHVVHEQQTLEKKYIALNDIVLSQGESSQLIEFDLWINDSFVCRQRADGLIVTTPTGSTAYALSAGGPILHPQLTAIAIVPMLPHKLTSRPIVINSDADIKIILKSGQAAAARGNFDSQQRIDLAFNDILHIRQYPEKLTLVHPKDYDYFKTLRDKLYWESR